MMNLNQPALMINEQRQREIAIDAMRAARASSGGWRMAIGSALIALGRRVAGERPTITRRLASRSMQPSA